MMVWMGIAAMPVVALGARKLTRKSKSLPEMEAEVDEGLHNAICAIALRPNLSDHEAYAVIVRHGGIGHLVRQAGLLVSIAAEVQSRGILVNSTELDKTVQSIRELAGGWFRRAFRPEVHAASIAILFSVCAAFWEAIYVDEWQPSVIT